MGDGAEQTGDGEYRRKSVRRRNPARKSVVRRVRSDADRAGPPLVLLVFLVGFWQFGTMLLDVPSLIFPSPVDVAVSLSETWPTLFGDALVTGVTAALGLVGGVVVGLLLAFGMTVSRTVEATVSPFVVGLRIAPMVAIAPLLFLWFGRGIPSRALLVTTLTLFPVTIASVSGLRAVPQEYLDLGRSVAASPWQRFFRIRVPAAAPSVFAGIKLAAALSVIGTVVSEFVALTAGLGYRVVLTSTNLETAETYAALLVLVVIGVVFYAVPARLERRVRQR